MWMIGSGVHFPSMSRENNYNPIEYEVHSRVHELRVNQEDLDSMPTFFIFQKLTL